MDVFKREIKWSTYQDRQLEVLVQLDKSFSSSLNISKDISKNLSKVEYAMTTIARELVSNVTDFNKGLDDIESSFKEVESRVNTANASLDTFTKRLGTAGSQFISTLTTVGQNLWNYFGGLRGIGDQSDTYSKLSNTLIQVSGMSGDTVRAFRSDIMNIVNELNKTTGNAYNAQDSYRQLVSIAGATTGNLEALKEMSKPLLLAQETLNGDIDSLGRIFSRFYTRYSFNSINMEDMVDEIRGSTAGNQATVEATLRNLEQLNTRISVYAKGDPEKITEMTKNLADMTAWLESYNIDSSITTNYLKDIADGDANLNSSLLSILSMGGSDGYTAWKQFSEGDFGAIGQTIINGYRRIAAESNIGGYGVSSEVGRTFGLDEEEMWNIAAANFGELKTFDEFLETLDKTTSSEELVEDKYISAADKANNLLENIYEKLSRVQETLGFGVSDIAIMAMLLRGSGLGGIIKSVGSKALGGLGGLGARGIGAAVGGVGAAGGALGGMSLAAIAGPAAIAIVAAGGLAFVLKNAYDNATELTGNAKEVEENINSIGESLKRENEDRLSSISELNYNFMQEQDVTKQRELMLESGLFTEEELQNTADDQLRTLIDKYKDAAAAMGEITEGILSLAEEYYTEKINSEQGNFVKYLQNADLSSEQKSDVLTMMLSGVSDPKLQKKIQKALDKEYISDSIWEDILYGGKNAWLGDKANIKDQTLTTTSMEQIAGLLGINTKFTTKENMEELVTLYNSFTTAKPGSSMDSAYDAIVKAGLVEDIKDIYGDRAFSAYGSYSLGTNYIDKDQLAYIHEGEAVVPKRYNPAANMNELEILREQAKINQERASSNAVETQQYMSKFVEELTEIKEFLSYWKDDTIKREKLNEQRNKYNQNNQFISQYMVPNY